jgi:hypothetical protein
MNVINLQVCTIILQIQFFDLLAFSFKSEVSFYNSKILFYNRELSVYMAKWDVNRDVYSIFDYTNV